jgi:hypothetical protein
MSVNTSYILQNHTGGFIVAIDFPGKLKYINPSEKINESLPNIIFITALPEKEKEPWMKNPTDIKVLINECKNFFEVITLDL